MYLIYKWIDEDIANDFAAYLLGEKVCDFKPAGWYLAARLPQSAYRQFVREYKMRGEKTPIKVIKTEKNVPSYVPSHLEASKW